MRNVDIRKEHDVQENERKRNEHAIGLRGLWHSRCRFAVRPPSRFPRCVCVFTHTTTHTKTSYASNKLRRARAPRINKAVKKEKKKW